MLQNFRSKLNQNRNHNFSILIPTNPSHQFCSNFIKSQYSFYVCKLSYKSFNSDFLFFQIFEYQCCSSRFKLQYLVFSLVSVGNKQQVHALVSCFVNDSNFDSYEVYMYCSTRYFLNLQFLFRSNHHKFMLNNLKFKIKPTHQHR